MSAVAAQAAQAQDASTKDDKEIYNYRLTMDKARAAGKANDAMLALLKAAPAYVTAEFALLAGTMGAAVKKAGVEVPKEFNPEHIAFAEKDSAELTQILATLDQINKLIDDDK
jgi:hypothetical protein